MSTLTSKMTNERNSQLTVMTYNLHGFNQGKELLSDVCNKKLYDVIFVQEHWLSSANIHKLDIFNDYSCYGVPAMQSLISRDILLGRPYGGVCSLINNKFINHVTPVLLKDRVVILKVYDYLFINVYLPCKDKSGEYKDILLELLGEIDNAIEDVNYSGIIFGGDLNSNLCCNKEESCIIKNFLHSYNLSYIDIIKFNSCELYTYSNSSTGCYSIIDYICVPSSLLDRVVAYDTVSNAINFSDHEPVEIRINVSITDNNSSNVSNSPTPVVNDTISDTDNHTATRFRFDHGNTSAYYDCTRDLIEPISIQLSAIYNGLDYNHSIDELCNNTDIEYWYTSIVGALLQASHATIPCTGVKHFKHWWSNELTLLKQQCILSHDAWKSNGRPKNGPLFEQKNYDKKQYRNLIHKQKLNEKQEISNSLVSSLNCKSGSKFWNTWKSKAVNKPPILPKIVGANSESSACNVFKEYFKELYGSVDNDFDSKMHNKFKTLLQQRSTFNKSLGVKELDRDLYNATLIDIAVNKLNNNTASGIDGLQKDHLKFAHPVVYSTLAKLFFVIMIKSYIPKQFSCGLIVPIQKDNSIKGLQLPDNFRGISLSPLISKVFETSVLFLYGKHMKSSDRQFGFKSGLGCTHAVYCIRNVIDFFVKNDSTVNVAFLDMAKAFDRLNHWCLFYKLLMLSVPLCVINILQNWYSKLCAKVKYGNHISVEFPILCGIRQGSIISPTLFNIYVDNILKKLSPYGCRMNNTCYGSFMYADDLVLLAPSVTELSRMIKLVCAELASINLKLNCSKSCCLRIGPRYTTTCDPIVTQFGSVPWVKESKYLGLTVVSHCNFKVSFNEQTCKFYTAFNSLYSRLGSTLDLNVLIHLLKTIALPILLYGIEALNLNKSRLNSLDFSLNRVLFKIFKVKEIENRLLCMKMFSIDSVCTIYNNRKKCFANKLNLSSNLNLRNLNTIN